MPFVPHPDNTAALEQWVHATFHEHERPHDQQPDEQQQQNASDDDVVPRLLQVMPALHFSLPGTGPAYNLACKLCGVRTSRGAKVKHACPDAVRTCTDAVARALARLDWQQPDGAAGKLAARIMAPQHVAALVRGVREPFAAARPQPPTCPLNGRTRWCNGCCVPVNSATHGTCLAEFTVAACVRTFMGIEHPSVLQAVQMPDDDDDDDDTEAQAKRRRTRAPVVVVVPEAAPLVVRPPMRAAAAASCAQMDAILASMTETIRALVQLREQPSAWTGIINRRWPR